jgi:hypothetical protein
MFILRRLVVIMITIRTTNISCQHVPQAPVITWDNLLIGGTTMFFFQCLPVNVLRRPSKKDITHLDWSITVRWMHSTLYHCLPSGNSILILRDLVTSYEHCKGSSVWCLFVWNVYAYDRQWNVFSFHVWAQTNQITLGIDQSRFTCRNWTAFSYESWAFLQVLILCSLADYRACLLFPWT